MNKKPDIYLLLFILDLLPHLVKFVLYHIDKLKEGTG